MLDLQAEHIVQLIDIGLLSFLLITSFAVVFTRQLMVSTILLSIFSLLMALMYMVMGAPDVAITEAAVGAGISTLLFIAVLRIVGEKEVASAHPVLPIIVVLITTVALVYATLGLPDYGDPSSPANSYLAPYYINDSYAEMGIPNVVTAILASYRGFDTLGEVFVVFTAGLSVLMLLRKDEK